MQTFINLIQIGSINTEKDFYSKYKKGELMDNAYSIIKSFASDLTIHKYQAVSINYAKYGLEKANFLYNGTINTIIYYDETNTYNLLVGKLPNSDKPEILITDFILDALKHFGIVDSNSTIYSILNKYIDLGYSTNFKIVGVIETNYKNGCIFLNINLIMLLMNMINLCKDLSMII